MNRVGIITIPDYNNYGNRLQNYAVREYFCKKGYETVTLEMNDFAFKKYKARKYKLFLKKYGLTMGVFLFEALTGGCLKAKRELYFEKFTKQFLNVKYIPEYTEELIVELNHKIDYFVLGSDQIWHPFVNDTPNLYFARFTQANRKIYFAPSFGVKELPLDYAEVVKKELSSAMYLSVREIEGAEIIKKLTGKQAEVLMDPTLMLAANEWSKIERRPKDLKDKKYILCYFLGEISPEYEAQIASAKKKYGAEVYYLADSTKDKGYVNGPSEFLYCIHHAQMILTDSFHAAVFSIIFHKVFNVFSRLNQDYNNAGLDSRVDTLLNKLKIGNHKYKTENGLCFDTDYNSSDEIIESEKQKTEQFIQISMKNMYADRVQVS